MGVLGRVIEDIFEAVEDLVFFLISYTLILFILGSVFGRAYGETEIFWWPIYILFVVLLIKIIKDSLE